MAFFKVFEEWSPIPTKQRKNNIKDIHEFKFLISSYNKTQVIK